MRWYRIDLVLRFQNLIATLFLNLCEDFSSLAYSPYSDFKRLVEFGLYSYPEFLVLLFPGPPYGHYFRVSAGAWLCFEATLSIGSYFSTSFYHLSAAVLLRYSISSISSYGRRFWISRSFVAIEHVIKGYEARSYGLRASQLETKIELDLNGG